MQQLKTKAYREGYTQGYIRAETEKYLLLLENVDVDKKHNRKFMAELTKSYFETSFDPKSLIELMLEKHDRETFMSVSNKIKWLLLEADAKEKCIDLIQSGINYVTKFDENNQE